MKKVQFLFLLMVMTILKVSFTDVKAIDKNDIQLNHNKEKGILSVSANGQYQWYYNGQPLSNQSAQLKIMADGNYTVAVTTESNGTITQSMNITEGAENESYKVFIIGDSTAQGWADVFYPQEGWGAVLQPFFDSTVTVVNAARSARSSKSFYDEGRWDDVKAQLSPGDYVLIQFGINDGNSDPARHTDPFTTFQDYLTIYVNEAREAGAHPILLSPVRRNSWNDTDPPTMYPSWHDYPIAVRELAQELDAPLIDIDQTAKTLMEPLGPEYTGPFIYLHLDPGEYDNYPDGRSDDVHFQEMGAIEMARLVVEGIEDLEEDTAVSKLIPTIRPMKEIKVTSNIPEAVLKTRTASYPEGVHVTLKAEVDSGYGFTGWLDVSDSTILDTNLIYSFNMDTTAKTIRAVIDDNPQHLDCQGTNYGSAFIDDCGNCVGGKSSEYACYLDFPNDTFFIKAIHSNKCIDGTDGFLQENCDQSEGQQWILEKDGDYYTIQNVLTGSYVGSNSVAQGQDIISSDEPVLWRFEEVKSGVYLIIPKDNDDILWDVYQVSTAAGVKLIFWERTMNDNQQFRIYQPKDCSGEAGGDAFIDSCGTCAGGTTGVEPVMDPAQCATSTQNITEPKNYKLGENPFSNESTLQVMSFTNKDFEFEVYNFKGELVNRYKGQSENILRFGTELQTGMYVGRIVMDDQVHTLKFLKK